MGIMNHVDPRICYIWELRWFERMFKECRLESCLKRTEKIGASWSMVTGDHLTSHNVSFRSSAVEPHFLSKHRQPGFERHPKLL